MTKDEGKTWLLELTQSIMRGLEASREDRARIWDAVGRLKENHALCREHVLKAIAELDKRTEMIAIKIGIYVSLIASITAVVIQEIVKHFFTR